MIVNPIRSFYETAVDDSLKGSHHIIISGTMIVPKYKSMVGQLVRFISDTTIDALTSIKKGV